MRRHPSVRLTPIVAIIHLWLSATAAFASTPVTWAAFESVTYDCDVVQAVVTPAAVPPGTVEIVLESGAEVDWWKAVAFLSKGQWRAETWTDRPGMRNSMTVPFADLQAGGQLELEKAKLFGVHTGMYLLTDMAPVTDGARLTFEWLQDGCWQVRQSMAGQHRALVMAPGTRRIERFEVTNIGAHAWSERTFHRLGVAGSLVSALSPGALLPAGVVVRPGQKIALDLEIAAPAARCSKTSLGIGILQRGLMAPGNYRDSTAVVELETTDLRGQPCPAPRPPVEVPKTGVPKLVGLAQPEAEEALAKARLVIGRVRHLGDEATPHGARVVVQQDRSPGALVSVGTAQNFDTGDPTGSSGMAGWAGVDVYNCATTATSLWVTDSGGIEWRHVGDLPPQWRDNRCPDEFAQPLSFDFRTGRTYGVAVVDVTLIGCRANHPADRSCNRLEWWAFGDEKGPRRAFE